MDVTQRFSTGYAAYPASLLACKKINRPRNSGNFYSLRFEATPRRASHSGLGPYVAPINYFANDRPISKF